MIPKGENMKKSTRLNHMMIYINEKQSFQLRDLMQEFKISKSTAIRDIRDLEELGVPLYSINGKHGGYKVLRDRYVTNIGFTDEEMINMMFALNSISSINQLPFQVTYDQLYKKMYQNMSPLQKDVIKEYNNKILYFNNDTEGETNKNMEEILNSILNKNYISFKYGKIYIDNTIGIGYIYKNNKWYLVSYDENSGQVSVLDNNKISSLTIGDEYINELAVNLSNFRKYMVNDKTIRIELTCNELGINNIQNYLWTDFSIEKAKNNNYIFRALINKKDINYIAKLIYRESLNVSKIKPKILNEAFVNLLKENLQKFIGDEA